MSVLALMRLICTIEKIGDGVLTDGHAAVSYSFPIILDQKGRFYRAGECGKIMITVRSSEEVEFALRARASGFGLEMYEDFPPEAKDESGSELL